MDEDAPIELLVQELRSSLAWKLLEERLLEMRDRRVALLVTAKPSTEASELQRHLGYIEALNAIAAEPQKMEEKARKAKIG